MKVELKLHNQNAAQVYNHVNTVFVTNYMK